MYVRSTLLVPELLCTYASGTLALNNALDLEGEDFEFFAKFTAMKKLSRDDRRAQYIATNTDVTRNELAKHLAGKHQWVLATTRADGRPQMSLVSGGQMPDGRLAIATYPQRVKAKNIRKNPHVSVAVMGAEFNDAWVQIDGDAEVVDLPEATEVLVEYFRSISGEHDDWDDYREAMTDQGKCAIVITPTRWSPVSTGGFPPELFEDE